MASRAFTVAVCASVIAGPATVLPAAAEGGSTIFGVTFPAGYRQLELIAPSQEAGAFLPGHATTALVMVTDAARYASTGRWGFGHFVNGVAVDQAQHETCFGYHQARVKDHDHIFTRLSP